MAAPRLTSHDKKDLDKFTKYLVYKCIQIIVQSRLGERVKTQSKPVSSGSDWFNLAIKDQPDVLAETKKVFTGGLAVDQHVCVEISLKTSEGETMILETWWVTMSDQCDATARVSYTVYNRMAVMLKSLFCVSRATPAYRLSRRQGPETFVVCYRIYQGNPQTLCLGDGHIIKKCGAVPTPVGTISLSVAYRVKMLISPHQSTRDLAADLKDDHFKSVTSPKRITNAKPCRAAFRDHRDEEPALQFGDGEMITPGSSPQDAALSCQHNQTYIPINQNEAFTGKETHAFSNGHTHHNGDDSYETESDVSLSKGQRLGAFAPARLNSASSGSDEIPFSSLLPHRGTPDHNANTNSETGSDREGSLGGSERSGEVMDVDLTRSAGSSSNKSTTSHTSHTSQASGGTGDFVMVELKTPFAGHDVNTDLGKFYKECQVAPGLTMCEPSVTIEDTLNSITDQLARFEANANEFDDFVNTLEVATEG